MRPFRWAALAVACVPMLLRAQVRDNGADAMSRALAAERRGAYADAAVLFGGILAERPADAAALFGIERVLRPLERLSEMVSLVQHALAADSDGVGVLQVAVRTYTVVGRPELARRYALRWADRAPEDPAPFEEWSSAAAQARDLATARAALDLGRQRLKDPTALSPDLALMMQQSGDVAGAAREWAAAVRVTPEFRSGAASMLSQVPQTQRGTVRTTLQDGSTASRQLLGLVELMWGNFTEGTALVRNTLPSTASEASILLESAVDALHGREDRGANLARGTLLEALAIRESGAAAVRTRLEAARAYADAGADRDARRLLTAASTDPLAPPGTANIASAAMLGVLISEGKAEEAEQVLGTIGPTLSVDDRERETRRVAMAFARKGNLAHAEQLITSDSSIAGLDLHGRLRLFVGDLKTATALLMEAGPYDDERDHAVERVSLLVMLQSAGKDSMLALGEAMLLLERGDSAKAEKRLADLSTELAPAGAAEARLLVAQLALSRHDTTAALASLRLADDSLVPGVAPAARLQLARLTASAGRNDEARTLLEQLIVDYPESAVVPEARRFRDSLRGAIPGGGH